MEGATIKATETALGSNPYVPMQVFQQVLDFVIYQPIFNPIKFKPIFGMPARKTLIFVEKIWVMNKKIKLAITPGNHRADAAERISLFIILKNSLQLIVSLVNEPQWAVPKVSSSCYFFVSPMAKKKSPLRILGNCTDTTIA